MPILSLQILHVIFCKLTYGTLFVLSFLVPRSQQRFHKITQAYYRGSHGIVLVYDVANPETLDNIGYWMKSIRENSRENADSKQVQICLVGNKVI